jgi:hypothetical protein
MIQNQVISSASLGDLVKKQVFGVQLLSTNSIEFVSGEQVYSTVEGSVKRIR